MIEPSSNRGLPLSQLQISRFRGLQDVELRNLQRINFLVGRGNSGKTSVLESIAAFASPLDVREWVRIARFREARANRFYPLQSGDVLRWIFPHSVASNGDERHAPVELAATGSSPTLDLRAECVSVVGMRRVGPADYLGDDDGEDDGREDGAIEDEGWRFRLEATTSHGDKQHLEFVAWSTGTTELPPKSGPHLPCQLIAPYAHRSDLTQLKALTHALVGDYKADITALLHDLDPKVLGVEIIADSNGERALLALRHADSGLAPIHVFGDGIRRALMIAMAIRSAAGGILLLDEIEAALHVSALGTVFPWLERACLEHNVQMIGTTHSLEALDAVAGCIETESVAAFHISGPQGEAKRYSKDMLRRLVHERGQDIR